MKPLQEALKEWAVISRALSEGRQALLLRKGGIAEKSGSFEVEHTRFWLFPTFVHQQKDGILPDSVPLLEQVESERPPTEIVRLTHFAEVIGVYRVRDLSTARNLAGLHCWTEETVQTRFEYRQPGLYVLPVRVYRSPRIFDVPDSASYAGCRSWVELQQALPTEGATAVLDEQDSDKLRWTLDRLLEPTAMA